MKKLVLALIFGFAQAAHAHILLTTPYQISGPTGIATASAPHATAIGTSFTWDATGNVACVIYAFGTATFASTTDSAFVPLAGAPTVKNCLNLTTGFWNAALSNGGSIGSGTLTGGQLSSAVTTYNGGGNALRDAADLFASTTFLLGTQPATW